MKNVVEKKEHALALAANTTATTICIEIPHCNKDNISC
jgi:hypothetical protein